MNHARKHLGFVERDWFQIGLLGRDLPVPWSGEDPDADMRIEADESVDGVVRFDEESIEESRAIIARSSRDDVERADREKKTLRWILVHMIEETARHAGQCDILREQTDGAVGN